MNIALLDPISSGEGLKRAAKKLGYKTVCCYIHPPSFYEDVYHISTKSLHEDADEVIFEEDGERLLQRLRDLQVKAVIAGSEGAVEIGDKIAHSLNLFGNSYSLSLARRDKGKMREQLKKSNLTYPDFAVVTSEKEIVSFATSHDFPLMVKTPKGVMTSNIFQCDDVKSVVLAFHEIYGKKDLFGKEVKNVVIEEYIGGDEYIVDTFSDGKDVHFTDVWVYEKINTEKYKNIHYNAITLPFKSMPSLNALLDYAKKVVQAFGIIRGPAHLELKLDPKKGPVLIEIGARLAGARIPQEVQKYSNFDPYKATVEVFVLGETAFPKRIVFTKNFATVLCPLLQGGIVKNISGIEEIKKLSSYEFHLLSLKVGEMVSPSTHQGTIPLFVFLAHPDRKRLIQEMKEAHELFKVELK